MFGVCLGTLAAAGCLAAGVAAAADGQGGTTAPGAHCTPGIRSLAGSPTVAWAAAALRPTTAFQRPGVHPFERFGLRNANGVDTVFGILAERIDRHCRPNWYHVDLPIRPNGATGWVHAWVVRKFAVHSRITVDLSQRRVRLYRNGKLVLSTPAAVGSSATPTPLGRFYVNQRLIPSDPGGPFGPGAVGISAFSPVLTGWTQGGPVAIHGTNEPWSIGHAVSNGCIRIPNAALRRLFPAAPSGTPVLIHP